MKIIKNYFISPLVIRNNHVIVDKGREASSKNQVSILSRRLFNHLESNVFQILQMMIIYTYFRLRVVLTNDLSNLFREIRRQKLKRFFKALLGKSASRFSSLSFSRDHTT